MKLPKGDQVIADPVIWVNEHNPMITSLPVTAITFSDEVRSLFEGMRLETAIIGE